MVKSGMLSVNTLALASWVFITDCLLLHATAVYVCCMFQPGFVRWAPLLHKTTLTTVNESVLLSRPFFRSRDRDLDKMNSSLETMVSRSHHWLHQFQLVTEHSLKGATNYGNRATGVGTKHAVMSPRLRPGQNELESQDHGLEITTLKWIVYYYGALPWLLRERCLSVGHNYVPW